MTPRWPQSLSQLLPGMLRPKNQSRRGTKQASASSPRSRPGVEALEDRVTPAVTATQNGAGLLTVTLGSANDSATIRGTSAGGSAIDVIDGASNTQSFTGVTGISIVDSGASTSQSVTFDDNGAGTAIGITGTITVSGVESVIVATANSTLGATSLNITGATTGINLGANVTTTGPAGQSYGGPVTVSSATETLTAGGTGGVIFSGTIEANTSGANALVVNAGGVTSFGGAIGGTKPLSSITTDAAGSTNIAANVNTTGGQAYGDPVIVSGSIVSLISSSSGNISFAGTINGQNAAATTMAVNTAGATQFGGAIGATKSLAALSTDAPGTTSFAGSVTTSGNQSYLDPVTVSGTTITFTATATNSNVTFNDTLNAQAADTTALTVSASGTTTFGGNVGATTRFASLTTDSAGTTVFGAGAGAVSVATQNAQTYNDAVKLNAPTVTFTSANNGNLTFASTLNGSTAGANSAVFNTGGTTALTGIVGGTTPLSSILTDNAGQTDERTIIGAAVTTAQNQTYNDPVTITPGTSVTGVTLTSTAANVSFAGTVSGTSAVPVTIQAGNSIVFGGNVTLSAAGSKLTIRAATSGAGGFGIASGLTFRADTLIWQAGDGPGGSTGAAADLVTNAPAFRNAAGTAAPNVFVFHQDAGINDGNVPTAAQFGGTTPASYTLISDDGGLSLTTATVAGANTTTLNLIAAQTVSIGEAITAPQAIVRLQSTAADVTQTAGGAITAASLGVRAATGINLSAAGNLISGTFAAASTAGDVLFAAAAPVTVGNVGTPPEVPGFTATSGVVATAGNVSFSQSGSAPLKLTIAAPVSGTTVTVTGGSGDDSVSVNYTLGATLSKGLIFNGGGGNDSLALNDGGGTTARSYTINNGVTRDSDPAITYTGVETVGITGGSKSDTFTVTPDATTAFNLVGGDSTGNTFSVNLSGATNPVLSSTKASDGYSGSAASSNLKTVTFSQMGTINPQADIQVTATAPTSVVSGNSVTITVVVKNAGSITANGVSVTDLIPAGLLSAGWTASASSGSSVSATSGTGDIHVTVDLAAGGSVTFTITGTVSPQSNTTITNTATAGSPTNAFDPTPNNNVASASISTAPLDLIAVGSGTGGGPEVKVYNADGTLRFNFLAFDPSYTGGVTVATGDLNSDGVEDVVVGSALGSSNVKVYDGKTGNQIASFFAFPGFTGGVNLAVADGKIIVGAGPGGGPIFNGYQLVNGNVDQVFSLFAYDPAFRGGVQVGAGNGRVVVGAGPGGGPHVKVFDLATMTVLSSFFAFPPGSTDGVSVAVGSRNGSPTVIAGAGPGSSPAVVTFDAQSTTQISSVLAYDARFRGGVRVASTIGSGGNTSTILGTGPGGSPRVRVVSADGTQQLDFFAYDPAFTGGVYVG